MAAQVEYTTDRPSGKERSVDHIQVKGKNKRLVGAQGYRENTVTIIGDSIIQFMRQMTYVSVQAIPGSYARDLISICEKGDITLSSFRAVIVSCGTNDLCDSTPEEIVASFAEIIRYIRQKNPTCRLAICGILPRPCDNKHPLKLKARVDTNEYLMQYCKRRNVAYFKLELALKGKGPEDKLYYTDKLHLSDTGVKWLKSWLEGRIGSLLGMPPQWTPPSAAPSEPNQKDGSTSK
jgi:type III secretion system FlhB-like substrate exporter